MNVERAKKLNKLLMRKHGLTGWRSIFSPQFTWALGGCRPKERVLIYSTDFIKHNPFHAVKDLMLHEIAHALDKRERIDYLGFNCHDEVWKNIAISIGCSGNQFIDSTKHWLPKPKYKGVCWRCNKQFFSRHLAHKYYCENCYDFYTEDYDLDKDGNKKWGNYRIRMHKIKNVK